MEGKKKSYSKVYRVKASIGNIELTKATTSTTLEIFANKQKLGTLKIGRGSLYWYGRRKKRRKRIDWASFAEKMDKLAYGEKYL